MAQYSSIYAIQQANKGAGFFFFEPDTLRFFSSRILSGVYGGQYFVTSERNGYDAPRRYTIRKANDDGSIDTVGEFQEYATASRAITAVKRIAQEGGDK